MKVVVGINFTQRPISAVVQEGETPEAAMERRWTFCPNPIGIGEGSEAAWAHFRDGGRVPDPEALQDAVRTRNQSEPQPKGVSVLGVYSSGDAYPNN